MRSSDCGAPGRGDHVQPRRLRQRGHRPAARRATSPFQPPNAVAGEPLDRRRARSRRPRSASPRPAGSPPHGNARTSSTLIERERPLAAERRVAVRMVAVEQPDERAIGDRARHVAQLRQPMQPQLAHPLEVGLGAATAAPPCRRAATAPAPAKRLSAVTRRAAAASEPMSESSCAPIARQRLVHLDRRARRRCPRRACRRVIAASPSLPGGSSAAPRRTSSVSVTTGIAGVTHGPDAQAVRQRRLLDRRKDERGASGPGSGRRDAVDRSRNLRRTSSPASPATVRPRGTMLSVTRRGRSRWRRDRLPAATRASPAGSASRSRSKKSGSPTNAL